MGGSAPGCEGSTDDTRRGRQSACARSTVMGERSTSYALRGVDLTVEPGEFVAVMGPSGSGKSTFMHDRRTARHPDCGHVSLRRHRRLPSGCRRARRHPRPPPRIRLPGVQPAAAHERALKTSSCRWSTPACRRRNAAHRARQSSRSSASRIWPNHHPNQMSGGQQQRVAIARSLVNDPGLILADEPTGALDTKTSRDVMQLFARLNEEHGITIMLVTHEPDIAAYARRIVTFRDGRIIARYRSTKGEPHEPPGNAPPGAVRPSSATRCARCSRCSASSSASPP